MFDMNGVELQHRDVVYVTPSYEESEGGQNYDIWYGEITIVDGVTYLDYEVLTEEEAKRVVKTDLKRKGG